MNFQLPFGWCNSKRASFFQPSNFEMRALRRNGRKSQTYHTSNIQQWYHEKKLQVLQFRPPFPRADNRVPLSPSSSGSGFGETNGFLNKEEFRKSYYRRVNAEVSSCLVKLFGDNGYLYKEISGKLSTLTDTKDDNLSIMKGSLISPTPMKSYSPGCAEKNNKDSSFQFRENCLQDSMNMNDESGGISSSSFCENRNRKVVYPNTSPWSLDSIGLTQCARISPITTQTSPIDILLTPPQSRLTPTLQWTPSPLTTGGTNDGVNRGSLKPLRSSGSPSPLAMAELYDMNEEFLSPLTGHSTPFAMEDAYDGNPDSLKFIKHTRMRKEYTILSTVQNTTLTRTTRIVHAYSVYSQKGQSQRKLLKRKSTEPDERIDGFYSFQKITKVSEIFSTSYRDWEGFDDDKISPNVF